MSVVDASSDNAFDPLADQTVSVTNADNDSAGYTVTPTSLGTTEGGGTQTFTVVLTAAPASNVVFSVTSGDTSEGTVSPGTLTFTPGNYNVAQTVTVTPVEDPAVDGPQTYNVTVSVVDASSDNAFDPLADQTVSVTNADNDSAGYTVSPLSLTTVENGPTQNFTVVLTSAPTSNVVFSIISSNPGEGTVSSGTLTFTPGDYNLAQTVTVTPIDDAIVDGPRGYAITISVVDGSSDDAFDPLANQTVNVTNNDDDTAGFTVTPTSLNTTEGGGTQPFTVALDAAPASNVVLLITSQDTSEGTVSPTSFLFTPANWNTTTRTVNVTPQPDAIVDGDITYNVTVSVDDANSNVFFDDLPDQNVSVTNADSDTAGVIVTAIIGNTTESGGTATFNVFLESQPSADVTIALTSSDPGEGTVPTSVTLTPVNWNDGVQVIVTGVEDTIVDGEVSYTIQTGDVTSTDSNYASLTPDQIADVTVINNDNDIGTITINSITVDENVGIATLTVTLNTDVEGGLTVDYTTSNNTALAGLDYTASAATLNFTGNTGETQPIDIVINDDILAENSESLFVTLSNMQSPGTVNFIPANGIANITITDNDAPNVTINDITVNEDDGLAIFTITLTGGDVLGGFDVSYETSDDTALEGEDYVLSSGLVTFAGTDAEIQTISIPLINDTSVEQNNEDFFVNLLSTTSPFVSIGDPQGIGTIIDDDICTAGTTAPVIDTNVPTSFCDVPGQDLDEYTITEPPTGTTLNWTINSDHVLDQSSWVESFIDSDFPGTYYGFFYDPVQIIVPVLFSKLSLEFNTTPQQVSTTDAERCDEGTVILNAIFTEGTVNWYAAATGGTPIGTGEDFETPILTATTTFYAQADFNGCVTARFPVVATVFIPPSAGIPSNTTSCNVAINGPTTLDLDDQLEAADPGTWALTTDPSGGALAISPENIVNFDGLAAGDYVFTYTTTDAQAPCVNESVTVTITVTACDVDTDNDGLTDGQEIAIGTDPGESGYGW